MLELVAGLVLYSLGHRVAPVAALRSIAGFYTLLVRPRYNPIEETVMKITMDIECTPEEARRFLGLPDVTGSQEK